jgi:hypothetical protein
MAGCSALLQGDYDRQLHKMALAAQRKQAVLLKLLDVTSRHLLLLLLGGQEWARLGCLAQELTAAHVQLEGHVERVRARVNRCVACLGWLAAFHWVVLCAACVARRGMGQALGKQRTAWPSPSSWSPAADSAAGSM